MAKRKNIDFNTKQKTVQQVESKEISLNQAARNLQVSPSTVNYWIKKSHAGQLLERPSAREKALEKENEKLKATIGDLYYHIEQIKKMADSKRRTKSASTSVITEKNLAQFVTDARS